MMLIEYFKSSGSATKKIISIIALIALGGAYMFTEGSIFGLGMTLIFYFLKEKKYQWQLSTYYLAYAK